MRFFLFLLILAICPISALSQIGVAKHRNRDAWQMESRELRVTVMQVGGHIAEIVLKGEGEINPLWLPERPTLDPTDYIPEKHEKYFGGGPAAKLTSGLLGHNLCFPYWGDPSEEEYRAGMTYHGEVGIVRWTKLSEESSHGQIKLMLAADLPESKTRFVRTLVLISGEPVVYFEGRAENLAALDRPVGWCEHVTVGPPFLKKGVTIFDASLTRGRNLGDTSGKELLWPNGEADGLIDLRRVRNIERSGFVNNFLVDPTGKFGYFVAINPEVKLLIGYLFRRTDFPWVNVWEANEPATKDRPAMLARGLEFSNTPTHGSFKALVQTPMLFGVPAYEWLDARSKLVKKFCAFSTKVPDGFSGVQEIRVVKGQLEIVERGKERVVTLAFHQERLE